MQDDLDGQLAARWFPVARGKEAVKRHVFQTQLLGQEIAVWRDDSGYVNAWENRCPHRGVRLSIGLNTGTELRCQYHGWCYASGSGRCTFIPAHPDEKPPTVIRATSYGSAEHCGFVWVSLGQVNTLTVPSLAIDVSTTLRSIFVEAPAVLVAETLANDHEFALTNGDGFILQSVAGTEGEDGRIILLLQPLNTRQTLIHGLASADVPEADRKGLLRRQNAQLSEIRDAMERIAACARACSRPMSGPKT